MSLEIGAAKELPNSKQPDATSSPELAISVKAQDITRVHDSSVSSGGSCSHTSELTTNANAQDISQLESITQALLLEVIPTSPPNPVSKAKMLRELISFSP